MLLRRKRLNISLIFLALILGGLAVWIHRLPPVVFVPEMTDTVVEKSSADTLELPENVQNAPVATEDTLHDDSLHKNVSSDEQTEPKVRSTRFKDIDMRTIATDNPFRAEAIKVMKGHLEETDSVSRHRILSYCEHLRTSYTTRDIDFIRQVFSENALIIVGHVVKSGSNSPSTLSYSPKVTYSIRSKQEYLSKLAKIFASNKKLDVKFSDFKILRHPTVPGIYGVTLRQKYACDTYSDDGYLFLLWDFRDPSMPLIHVRTWQPSQSIEIGGDEVIDMSDFNFE
ncbi:MAG: hypothetical protein K2J12_10810 [Muribaculaceae bacterium]|nr:hypothetical protein [Muribaculaceae bacterium]